MIRYVVQQLSISRIDFAFTLFSAGLQLRDIDRITHDLRRTAIKNLEMAGVLRSAAMVAHKTQSIYSRYAIVDNAMLTSAAQKLDVLHEAQRKRKIRRK